MCCQMALFENAMPVHTSPYLNHLTFDRDNFWHIFIYTLQHKADNGSF